MGMLSVLDFQRLTGLINRSAEHEILKCMSRIWGSKYFSKSSPMLVVPTKQQGEGVSNTPLNKRLLLKPALNKSKALNSMVLSVPGLNRGCYLRCTV